MGIILVLIFFNLSIVPTFQEKVATDLTIFKQKVDSFSESVRFTEKKIEDSATPASPTCIIAKLSQISVQDKNTIIAIKFKRNIEFLDAICAFTNDRYVVHSIRAYVFDTYKQMFL